ncbi:hypothetical protein [Tenacibaculum sp. 190524A02b]|uniref:hypothetical protein n=1 Tax=Tenacibaculum vairaonense TaxID=3137860 RepID=UPI0032B159B2
MELIESTKGTEIYNRFQLSKNKTDSAWERLKKAKEDEKVFGFTSLRYFIERFGLMLCIFVYALYNLVKSSLRERKNIGAMVMHSFIISISFFYFYWIFQSFQDVSIITYIFMTVFSAALVSIAVYFITKYNKDRITKLREQMFFIARLGLRSSKPEKKEVLLNEFRKIAHDK